MWFTLIFGGTAILFLAMTLSTLFHLQWAHRLPTVTGSTNRVDGVSDHGIQCSIVIAARDEAARIEDTVRHVLAQQDVRIEVIVVDDRSTDGTSEVLDRLTQLNGRVRSIRVHELPDGWLGKCHACHMGAASAKGDWILFMDADCWLTPDVLSRALRVADREEVDHVTLTPGVDAENIGAQAWHLAFLITLSDWFSGVNRNRPQRYMGMGAFNLVRASTYRQCGGYEALRMTVIDDLKLGLLICRAGKRTRGYIGGKDVECDWGTTVQGMIKIMEKNYFAAMGFRFAAAMFAVTFAMLFWGLAIIGLFTGSMVGIAATLAMFTVSIPAYILARRLGWGASAAILTPLIFPLLFYAMFRSTIVTMRKGGVSWRGTFYSLDALRTGMVR